MGSQRDQSDDKIAYGLSYFVRQWRGAPPLNRKGFQAIDQGAYRKLKYHVRPS